MRKETKIFALYEQEPIHGKPKRGSKKLTFKTQIMRQTNKLTVKEIVNEIMAKIYIFYKIFYNFYKIGKREQIRHPYAKNF